MQQPDTVRLLNRGEVEKRFGISKRFLEVASMQKEGPRTVRIGRLVRYRVKDIEAWIEANATLGGSCHER